MITLENYTPEVIMEDLKRLQYLYGLKKEIRYAQTRHGEDTTESVAEHVYGMHICAMYFLSLENPEGSWDKVRIYEMMTVHDIDEIETGDVLGYLKDDAMKAAEADAMRVVMEKSPTHMQSQIALLIDEYDAQVTPESRFAKAIDKIEPLVHCYNSVGKAIFLHNKTTELQSRTMKDKYIKDFPFIKKFSEVVQSAMVEEGFFYKD